MADASASGIRAGRSYVELGIVDAAFRAGIDAAASRLKAFGAAVAKVGAGVAAFGGLGLGFLVKGLPDLVETSKELKGVADRTGLTVEAVSELKFAFGDLELAETSVKRMQKFLFDAAQGSASAAKTLDLLNLSVADLVKMSPDEQFMAISKAVSSVANATDRAALAMEVFGRSGTAGLHRLGRLPQLREEGRNLGLTLPAETVNAAAAFGRSLSILKQQIGAVFTSLSAALVPGLGAFVSMSQPYLARVIQITRANSAWVQVAGAASFATVAFGTALAALGGYLALAGVGLSRLGALVSLLLAPVRVLIGTLTSLTIGAAWQAAAAGVGLFRLAVVGAAASFGLLRAAAVGTYAAIVSSALAVRATIASLAAFVGGVAAAFKAAWLAWSVGAGAGVFAVTAAANAGKLAVLGLGLAARVSVLLLALSWFGAAGAMSAASLSLAAGILVVKAGMIGLALASIALAKVKVAMTVVAAAAYAAGSAVVALAAALKGAVLTAVLLVGSGGLLGVAGAAVVLALALAPLVVIAWQLFGGFRQLQEVGTGFGKIKDAVAGLGGAIAGAGRAALDWSKGVFTSLRESSASAWQAIRDNAMAAWASVKVTGTQAFEAISVAIKAGDWQAAFAVAVAAISLEWAKLRGFLEVQWVEFKAWFVEQAVALAVAASNAFAGIQSAWVSTVQAMTETMRPWITRMKAAAVLMEGLKSGNLRLIGLGLLILESPQGPDKEAAEFKERKERENKAALDAVEERRKEREKALTGLNDEVQGGKAGGLQSAKDKARERVEQAQKKFDEAREQATAGPGLVGRIGAAVRARLEGVSPAMAQAAAKMESVGTFTTAAASQIGAQGLDAQQLDAMKEVARGVEKTNEKLDKFTVVS